MSINDERSAKAALHNFTMPCDLRWGNQRFLRCMRVNSDAPIPPLHRFTNTTADSHSSANRNLCHPIGMNHRHDATRVGERRDSPADGSRKLGSPTLPPLADHGIAAVRERVMLDLQTAAGEIKNAIFRKGLEDAAAPQAVQGENLRPWSLRTRRASSKTMPLAAFSAGGNGGCVVTGSESGKGNRPTVDAGRPRSGFSPPKPVATVAVKSPSPTPPINDERKERQKFAVALSKREIEEDFYAMASHRPPRRPKKRAKTTQKYLDTIFPGLWLTEVTPEMYKVTESAP